MLTTSSCALLLCTLLLQSLQTVNSNHLGNYGKSCSKDYYPDADKGRVQCDRDHNMHCSEKGFCECIEGEGGRIFTHYENKCIEVASISNNFVCRDDIQCKLSSYGKYSRCNRDYDRCQCFDDKEKTEEVDSVCYIKSVPSAVRNFQDLQGCSSDGDCHASSLGMLSRCNKAGNVCECYNYPGNSGEVAFFNGTCVLKKSLMQFCVDDNECRAGHHKNAFCGAHGTYLPSEKVCQCPEGIRCDGDDDGSGAFSIVRVQSQSILMVGLTTAIMGLLATKVFS